jgi:hypothetical protein
MEHQGSWDKNLPSVEFSYNNSYQESLVSVFCTDKIWGGQYRMFHFQCDLANHKAHYDLSWFKPLLGGNDPMFSGLILKMNRDYKG